MKLVHDADNIVNLDRPGLNDIAAMARKFADDIEAGEYGDALTALVLVDTEDELHTLCWGEGLTRYESAGMLSLALRLTFDD